MTETQNPHNLDLRHPIIIRAILEKMDIGELSILKGESELFNIPFEKKRMNQQIEYYLRNNEEMNALFSRWGITLSKL